MGKAGKVGLGLIVVVIAAVAIAVTLVFKNLDGIIKQVVETTGSDVLNTQVSLDSVAFTLTEGRGQLSGLSIANPDGFDTPYAFDMDAVVLQVDPGSLAGPVIVIKEVTVDGARLQIEQKGVNTNLKALLDGMDQSEPAAEPEPGQPADVRLMLEQFNFINSEATLTSAQWGEKNIEVPAINLRNMGDKTTGLTPTELANQMTSAVLKQAEKAASNHLKDLAKGAAEDEFNKQIDKNLDADDKAKLDKVKSLFSK